MITCYHFEKATLMERIRWWLAGVLCDVAQSIIPRGHHIHVGKSRLGEDVWP
jgi:hypothetical protein